VRLPKGADLIPGEASGYSVALVPGTPPAEPKTVEVRLSKRTAGPQEIQLAARAPLEKAGAGLRTELGGFEVVDAARESGHLIVAADPLWHATCDPPRGPLHQVEEPREVALPGASVGKFEYVDGAFTLPVRIEPRKTRIGVEPSYVALVSADQITLRGTLKYSIRAGQVDRLSIELPGWQFDDVGPENAVMGMGEVSPAGVLSVPLIAGSSGQVELKLRAHQRIAPDSKSVTFELPRPQADASAPATLVIVADDDVELSPGEGIAGIVRQQVAPQQLRQFLEGSEATRQQDPLFYRADSGRPAKAQFVGGYRVHPRKVAVSASARLLLEESRVEQKLRYSVAYRPIEKLLVEMPVELARREGLQILVDGKPASALDIPGSVPSKPGLVRRQIPLSSPCVGFCELMLKYAVDVPRLQPQVRVACVVPLTMPCDGELVGNRVSIVAREGIDVRPKGDAWTASDPLAPASAVRSGLQLATKGPADRVELEIRLEDQSALGSTVVNRAWVQTWLTQAERLDRAVFRFTSNQKSIQLVLPGGVEPGEVELLLEGQPIAAHATPDGHLVVPLPGDETVRQRVLEAVYRLPGRRPEPGPMSLELPRLGRDAWNHRTYWQLVLPPKEHIVAASDSLTAEYAWGWTGLFWGRKPTLEQPQLETWCGARRLTDVPGETNRYLFSALGSVDQCTLRTAMRPSIVLASSGIALIAGLLLIYVPAMRHPLVLLLAAIGLGAGAVTYPALALLAAQAGAAGVGAAVLAGLLQRAFGRRRKAGRDLSSAILEKSSTFTRYRGPVAGNESPTETIAATVPAPSPPPTP
jgi:hypothetical protein